MIYLLILGLTIKLVLLNWLIFIFVLIFLVKRKLLDVSFIVDIFCVVLVSIKNLLLGLLLIKAELLLFELFAKPILVVLTHK